MKCRDACGACCIAPSINTPLPGMPQGKPAGVPCLHLDAALRCALWADAGRPAFCAGLQASPEMCGSHRNEALQWLQSLELATRPEAPAVSVANQGRLASFG